MEEFRKRGLHIKYKKDIEEWFIYLDQVEFGKRLEKKMLKEIERFMFDKKTINEIVEELFKEPKMGN